MFQITVQPSQTQFTAQDDETILSAAIRHGYNLPHSCQGGVCGSCVARLLSGGVKKNGEYDDYVLTPEEREAGMILLCCSQADSDVAIEMPSYAGVKALPIRTLPARIGEIELRGKVAIVRVDLPKAPPFKFYAGQYMEFLWKDGARPYSIASATQHHDSLEFHILLRENGLFSPQLFDGRLTKGSIIRLRGPLGAFTLNEESHKPLILISTGTGFAPIKSILWRLIELSSSREIHVYHGTRSLQDWYQESEIQFLFNQLKNARYTLVLSRPNQNNQNENENGNWQGATGYVTEHVLRDYPDLSQHEVYACGLPQMIMDTKQAFITQANLPEQAYFSDAFTAHI